MIEMLGYHVFPLARQLLKEFLYNEKLMFDIPC